MCETCAALPPLSPFTISAHAQSQTLLQAAVLAAVAVGPVNQAVPLAGARVHGVILLTAAEEALHQKNGHITALVMEERMAGP